MGPGHGFEFCWILTPRRIIWAICLASQHTHLHLCPLCESPEEGPWGRWEVGSQAVCGGAPSGQACQVGEGSRRTSTEMEAPGVGPLTPPPPQERTYKARRLPPSTTAPRPRLLANTLSASLAYGSLGMERPLLHALGHPAHPRAQHTVL